MEAEFLAAMNLQSVDEANGPQATQVSHVKMTPDTGKKNRQDINNDIEAEFLAMMNQEQVGSTMPSLQAREPKEDSYNMKLPLPRVPQKTQALPYVKTIA